MELRGKRILVTGSSGFVGRALVRRLEEEGAHVRTFDVAAGADVTSWEQLSRIRTVNIVYHLAAVVFVPKTRSSPRETFRVNLIGTLNVLELCRLRSARLIFASSYVYGIPRYLPVDEKHPVGPTNPYAWSKVMGEELCRAYHQEFALEGVILRPFNIYGPGQSKNFLVPEMIRQLRRGRVLRLRDLKPRRDMLYLDDAVEAYVKAGIWRGSGLEVVNVGFGRSYSVEEIARRLIALSGKRVELESLGLERKGEIAETVADITKARTLLGWKPRVDLEEGLRRTLAWV